MKKLRVNFLDFEIDKLTESVEHVVSGERFATDVSVMLLKDLKKVAKKNGWLYELS